MSTDVALGAARAFDFLALALVAGPAVFLVRVMPRALRGGEFENRLWRLFAVGLALGVLAGVLGILLQGARVSGDSLWASLRWGVVWHTLRGRFGGIWGAGVVLEGVTLVLLASGGRARRWFTVWIAAVCVYLVATPALSGRAAIQSPVWISLPVNVAHVLAASVWVGGVVCVAYVLLPASEAAGPAERTPLLREVLAGFSALALAAVAVIAVTGVVQAYIAVRTVNALSHTTFGELVLVKIALLGLLLGLGAINRERVVPVLRRLAASGSPPGEAGTLLRRTTLGELAAMACVLAATAALVAYTPPVDAPRHAALSHTARSPLRAGTAPRGRVGAG